MVCVYNDIEHIIVMIVIIRVRLEKNKVEVFQSSINIDGCIL